MQSLFSFFVKDLQMEVLRRRCYTDFPQFIGLCPDKPTQLQQSTIAHMASPGKDQNPKYSFQWMFIALMFITVKSKKPYWNTVSRGQSINYLPAFIYFFFFKNRFCKWCSHRDISKSKALINTSEHERKLSTFLMHSTLCSLSYQEAHPHWSGRKTAKIKQ